MDASSITKSSRDNVIVGDGGSMGENACISTVTIKGRGSREDLMRYAHSKFVGMEILSESVEEKDGRLTYTGRVKSVNGVPFSQAHGRIVSEVPLIIPVKVDGKKEVNVFGFGDVVIVTKVEGNPFAFGDL